MSGLPHNVKNCRGLRSKQSVNRASFFCNTAYGFMNCLLYADPIPPASSAEKIKLIRLKSNINLKFLPLRELKSLFICNHQIVGSAIAVL